MPSDMQQQLETGQPSTTSQQVLQKELEKEQAIKNLSRMAAIDSLVKNLEAEDGACEREMKSQHALLFGSDSLQEEKSDDMRVLSAGSVTINQTQEAKSSVAKALATESSSLFKKALPYVATGMTAGGLGLASSLLLPEENDAQKVVPTPVVSTDTINIPTFRQIP